MRIDPMRKRPGDAPEPPPAEATGDFLAPMSHDLRTPLTSISGLAALLLDSGLTPDQRESVWAIRASADELMALLEDVLDYNRLERGRLEIGARPFTLRQTLEEALDLVAPRAGAKRLELLYQVEPGVPEAVTGDPARLRQVVTALVEHAVNATEAGQVVLTVRAQHPAVPDQPVSLVFEVSDTSAGVPPQDAAGFFEARTDAPRGAASAALRLALCKRLAERLGGSLAFEGRRGKGTTVHLTLPVAAADQPTLVPQLDNDRLRHQRVLIVDDNPASLGLLTQLAAAWGMVPEATTSPREALEWLHEGHAYDVAVVDHLMPGLDGPELVRRAQATPAGEKLAIVLLTALVEDRMDVERAGIRVRGLVPKPVKPAQLAVALARALKLGPTTQSRAEPGLFDESVAARNPLRILVAEDNRTNADVISRMLERLGYEPAVVESGREALRAVGLAGFDVILMDVEMPEMDGLEATRSIRKDHHGRASPWIVALTAHTEADDRRRCLEAGMDDHVVKPIRIADLVAALERAGRGLEGRRR